MAVVLVEFPCSFDGVTSETMVVGSERDFGSMTAGLVGLGWISGDPAAREVAVDVVPEVKAPVVESVVVAEPELVEPVAEPVAEPAPHPLEHDGNGKLGGSKPRGKRR